MKKLHEIPKASGSDEPPVIDWEIDKLIERLENEGHKTISVDRAVIVIEQCEEGDDFPKGWSADPLRVTVYPDPDAGFGLEPDYVFIHAGRAGLMDIMLSEEEPRGGRRLSRLFRVEAESFMSLCETNSLIPAMALRHLVKKTLAGYYTVHAGGRVVTRRDEELARLAEEVVELLDRYVQRLESYPDLFRGFRREQE